MNNNTERERRGIIYFLPPLQLFPHCTFLPRSWTIDSTCYSSVTSTYSHLALPVRAADRRGEAQYTTRSRSKKPLSCVISLLLLLVFEKT